MKWSNSVVVVAALVASAVHGLAQGPLYRAKEKTLDMFGSYLVPQRGISHVFDTGLDNGSFGGGFGYTYYKSAKLGIGTDVVMGGNGGSFVDTVTANVYYRLPLGNSGLAPYFVGGGGSGYEQNRQWIGQAGLGLEYRSYQKSGFFVDGRYVWGEHSNTDNLVLRFGLRVVF